jgi:2-iminobutanoate/2-iminopropanoate deaminase
MGGRMKPLAVLVLTLCLFQGVSSMQERRIVTADVPVSKAYSAAVDAGGLIYVSGLAGMGPKDPLATTDIASETRRAFDQLKAALEAAGSSLADLVNVTVYLKNAGDFDAMNAVYRTCVTDQPPARTTVAADLPDGALITISAVAVPTGAVRETLLPVGWVKSPRPYSYIVRTGDLVFLSGLVSRRGTDDQIVPGPVPVQMKTIMANAATLLKTAGLTFDNVVSARVFVTDDSLFEAMNTEYQRTFPINPPARATGVVGLMAPDNYVEVTLVASKTPKQVIGPQISPTLPVSTAIRAGRRIFVSGVLGNTDTNIDDLSAQTREAFTRAGRALGLAGATFEDVVESTIYVRDPWQKSAIDTVFHELFAKDPPAGTMAGVRLVPRGGLVEVLLTAYQ